MKSDASSWLSFGFGLTAVLALLAGCAVGPDYKKPVVSTPDTLRFATSQTTNSLADLPWREVFTDPLLQNLIATGLTNNYDLQQAAARVEQARYAAAVAHSQFFPQVNYGGDLGYGRNAFANSPSPLNGATGGSIATTVNAAWEIDFWGRIRRLNESARAQYLATEEARRSLTISLISDIASTYYQLLDLDQELEIERAATNAYAGSYRIFNDRLIQGVASKLETDRAAAALATAAAAIPQLEIQVAATEDQMTILLGQNPGPVRRGALTNQPPLAAEIPAGLPSDLLRRRPDILGSEQLLVSANAEIGVNVANFFPQIGLTTFLGRVSPELSAFTGGAAGAWSVGGSLAGPLFQGGKLKAQYEASKAKFDEAAASYQQSVITAFREVSDALITRQKLAEEQVFNGQAVTALESSVVLATDRYINGKSSYYEVLEAQQQLYPVQRLQVQTQAGEWIALVQLYKALGGGWPPAAPAPTKSANRF